MQQDLYEQLSVEYERHIDAAVAGDPDALAAIWRRMRKFGKSIIRRYEKPLTQCLFDEDDGLQMAAQIYITLMADWQTQRTAGDLLTYFGNTLRWSIVKMIKQTIEVNATCTSLDQPLSAESEQFTLADTIPADELPPDYQVESSQNVNYLLTLLPPIDREIIAQHCIDGRSITEVCNDLGIDAKKGSRIKKNAVKALKKHATELYAGASDYSAHKGVSAFTRTGTSIVEDIAQQRESITTHVEANRKHIIEDLRAFDCSHDHLK